jgi:hypothetical protein
VVLVFQNGNSFLGLLKYLGFARRDFEGVDAHLEVGGLILFDDSADFGPFGTTHLMKELAVHPRYEVVAKNPNYLVRKKGLD